MTAEWRSTAANSEATKLARNEAVRTRLQAVIASDQQLVCLVNLITALTHRR